MLTTRTFENHRLPNLPLSIKLLLSSALLVGWCLFAITWFYAIMIVNWSVNDMLSATSWGEELSILAWTKTEIFLLILVFHTVSLLLLFFVVNYVFKQSSLRRRMKGLISAFTKALLGLDFVTWFIPFTGLSGKLAFPVASLTGLHLSLLAAISLKQMWVYRRWSSSGKKRVVIVGGGFAGLYAVLGLDKILGYHPDLEIILFDRKNYFLFPPLLPSTATGTIETRQVTFPFRRIFETTNILFRKASVEAVHSLKNTVEARIEIGMENQSNAVVESAVEIPYDYLVLAPGSENQTFQTPGVMKYAFFMRELIDAIKLRNHIIDCFERAPTVEKEELQKELLSFVIVGGGPTGVEIATEIHDLIYEVLLKRYPEIPSHFISIWLIQSGEQILPGWNPSVVDMAKKQLGTLKIQLLLNARVSEVGLRSIFLKDGRPLLARTCVWCAGVKPSSLLEKTDLARDNAGRIIVEEDLRAKGSTNVFVLGDSAHCLDKKTNQALPALGQVAFQQGSHTSKNLVKLLNGQLTKPFSYFNFGALVSVGEHFASVDLLGLRFSGFLGWLVWRALYLAKLVGMSNKIRVLIDWTLDLLIERSIAQIRDDRQEPVHGK